MQATARIEFGAHPSGHIDFVYCLPVCQIGMYLIFENYYPRVPHKCVSTLIFFICFLTYMFFHVKKLQKITSKRDFSLE